MVVRKRTRFFFMRGFQFRVAMLVAGSLSVLLAFAVAHGFFHAQFNLSPAVYADYQSSLRESTIRFALVGVLYIVAVTVAAIFLSHRTVGPTERLEHELSEMAERETVTPLKIRDGDELAPLLRALNKLLERFRDSS